MTDRPFAMNLWVSIEGAGARRADEGAFKRLIYGIPPKEILDECRSKNIVIIVRQSFLCATLPSGEKPFSLSI